MKLLNFLGWALLAPWAAYSQPMNTNCNDALIINASFTRALVNYTSKNIEVITTATVQQDVKTWFETPLARMNREALINLVKFKKAPQARICTINYASYQNMIEQMKPFASKEIQNKLWDSLHFSNKRLPASATWLAKNTVRAHKDNYQLRQKVQMLGSVLSEQQVLKCKENMQQEGELRVLHDEEATQLYTQYLNEYLHSGGSITQQIHQPFLNREMTIYSLQRQLDVAEKAGHLTYARNLLELVKQAKGAPVYLARKSFTACPINGTQRMKILVPRSVDVVTSNAGDSEFFYENPKLWSASQAVEYIDTHVASYPLLLARGKFKEIKTYVSNWAREHAAMAWATVSPDAVAAPSK